jgi:guanine nucleotide-binding protein G(I)/G(S)/G(T) subunit beta-1
MTSRKELEASIHKCQQQISELSQQLAKERNNKKGETDLPSSKDGKGAQALGGNLLKLRKVLRGHFGKVYAMSWCHGEGKEDLLVSASQDGKLIIWDAPSTNKRQLIPLRSAWVMTVAYSPSGNFLACGGLDNVASIYKLDEIPGADERKKDPDPKSELAQHDGYLSSCKFVSDSTLVTASGDSYVLLWDVPSKRVKTTFQGHSSDVMSVAVTGPGDVFISGGCDAVAKVWDARSGTCVQTHEGHESDINSIAVFPDNYAFGTASDDSSCRLFDTRCWGEVNSFGAAKVICSITSLSFSFSGRILYAGYDDYTAQAWDVVKGTQLAPALGPHDNRVSCLGVNKPGTALCTGSWDSLLKCWA